MKCNWVLSKLGHTLGTWENWNVKICNGISLNCLFFQFFIFWISETSHKIEIWNANQNWQKKFIPYPWNGVLLLANIHVWWNCFIRCWTWKIYYLYQCIFLNKYQKMLLFSAKCQMSQNFLFFDGKIFLLSAFYSLNYYLFQTNAT